MPRLYRILMSPNVSSELEAIHRYIAQESPRGADAVITQILSAIDSLSQFPKRFPVYRGRRKLSAAVRRMVVPPYLVYFRINEKKTLVEIITIRHGKRRQPRNFIS